jgi:hypothetical protein
MVFLLSLIKMVDAPPTQANFVSLKNEFPPGKISSWDESSAQTSITSLREVSNRFPQFQGSWKANLWPLKMNCRFGKKRPWNVPD